MSSKLNKNQIERFSRQIILKDIDEKVSALYEKTKQLNDSMNGLGEEIKDVLCEQHKRTVNNNNCISFKGLTLPIPADQYRCHYVSVMNAY